MAEMDALASLAELYRMLGGQLREEIAAEYPKTRTDKPFTDPRTGEALPAGTGEAR